MGLFDVPPPYRPWLSVGTCSWKYDSWKGLVYDPEKEYRGADYLTDYAAYFSTVEVDQWFWSLFPAGVKLPQPRAVRSYAASVPDDFTFTVKAPNALTLTHFYARQSARYSQFANQPNPSFLDPELFERFLDTLAPLGRKLGAVMLQFEYLNQKKMSSLEAFLDRLHVFFEAAPRETAIAIESRNPNYLVPPFFDFLRSHGLGYVFLEGYHMPPIEKVFAEHGALTDTMVVLRLHGTEREGIEKKTGETWNAIVAPKDDSLDGVAAIIDAYARRKIRVYVNVNNHYEGSAPLTIQRLLKRLSPDCP